MKKSRILADGTSTIFLRFYGVDKKHHYYKMGLAVEAKHWDAKKERVKNTFSKSREYNGQLAFWVAKGDKIILEAPFITFSNFIDALTSKAATGGLIELFEEYITHLKNTNKHTKGTIANYTKVLRKCKVIWPNEIPIRDFSSKEIDKYFSYNLSIGNQKNTINRSIKTLKTIIRFGKTKGLATRPDALSYKLENSYTERVYLGLDELNTLHEYYNTTDTIKYKKVLRLFLFGCYTGLRYSDIVKLREEHIKDNIIIMKVSKSNRNLHTAIPLIQESKELLKAGLPFTVVGNQKCNAYLKEVAEILSLPNNLVFHSSRHTFATLALNFGIPLEVVSRILAHTKIATTQIYARMLNDTLVTEMTKFGTSVKKDV